MKKFILTVAIVISTSTAFAQRTETVETQIAQTQQKVTEQDRL